MTRSEYLAWLAWTNSFGTSWKADPCHDGEDGRDLWLSKGRQNGVFIMIDRDGSLSLGKYTDAIPHLGEAMFETKWRHKFASLQEAKDRLTTRGGVRIQQMNVRVAN